MAGSAATPVLDAAQWSLLRQHFESLCDLPIEQQQDALARLGLSDALHRRLVMMLGDDQTGSLTRSLRQPLQRLAGEVGQRCREGQQVGPYRLLRPLGRGGMGMVWLAERADGLYDGEVAIKFVMEGHLHQQFDLERRLLARLDHRGIARLLDAGEDCDGTPYLVMEYVRGVPLDQYARQQRLDSVECIGLIRQCARALDHAHGRLILHRDLKPDNILVDANGAVRVLDFGIAGMIDPADTSAAGSAGGGRFYTPRYAAPEQIAGEPVGTAADTYSLAVILFEMLSGQHPTLQLHEAGNSVPRRLLDDAALSLRSVLPKAAPLGGAQLRDLELVLAKALARDPAAGYGSAERLAEDLTRILDNRPVALRTTTRTELVWRWTQRQRIEASLVIATLLAIVIGGGLALWQTGLAREERDHALRQTARAERIADFMTGLFSAARPVSSKGESVLASDLLAAGRERLADELGDDPLLRASLLGTIGETWRSLGDYDAARETLDTALAELPNVPESAAEQRRLTWLRGKVDLFHGRYADALPWLTAAVDSAREQGDPEVSTGAGLHRAVALINLSRLDDAEAAAQLALQDQESGTDAKADRRINAHSLLSTIALMRGDLEGAHRSAVEVLEQRIAVHGAGHHGVAMDYNNVAAIELRLGRLQHSADNYRKAIAGAVATLGERHVSVALPMTGLAVVQRAGGDTRAALSTLDDAVRIYDEWAGENAGGGAYARYLQAELLWLLGDASAARIKLADAPAQLADTHGALHGHSCRAAVLVVALDTDAPIDRRLGALAEARACLLDVDAVPSSRLLADFVALQLEAVAVRSPALQASLVDRATALQPPDPALLQAIERL